MLDQRLRCRIDFTITTSRLLRGATKYKAVLKIQLNQRSQEAFFIGILCPRETYLRYCDCVIYCLVFNFIYVFYTFVVLETFVLLHFNAFSQAQTVLSDGEEKEETEC